MSYEKHTWETGETITAEKLNNLENGAEAFSKTFPIIHANVIYGQSTQYIITDSFENILNMKPSNANDFTCIVEILHSGQDPVYYYGQVRTGYAQVSGISIDAFAIKNYPSGILLEVFSFTKKSDGTSTGSNTQKTIS